MIAGSIRNVVDDITAKNVLFMPATDRQYVINLHGVQDKSVFVTAFNAGLIEAAGGQWDGNWDAFNDYLSWPAEEAYVLVLEGWTHCHALGGRDLAIFEEILESNPHVTVKST